MLLVRVSLFVFLSLLAVWLFSSIIRVVGSDSLTPAITASSPTPAPRTPASAAIAEQAASTAPPERPASAAAAGEKQNAQPKPVIPRDVGMLSMLFALCGALGATLHAMGSLVAFAGNEKFKDSWALWYLAQPLRGAILAAGFFWLMQGGLLGGIGAEGIPVNTLAMMGATFLVGLFSDPAIEKLREVFQVLFRTAGKPRSDPLAGRKPTIEAVKFDTARPGAVLIEGANFAASDAVAVNGAELAVVAGRTDKKLEVQLPATPPAGTPLRILVVPTQPNAHASNIFTIKTP